MVRKRAEKKESPQDGRRKANDVDDLNPAMEDANIFDELTRRVLPRMRWSAPRPGKDKFHHGDTQKYSIHTPPEITPLAIRRLPFGLREISILCGLMMSLSIFYTYFSEWLLLMAFRFGLAHVTAMVMSFLMFFECKEWLPPVLGVWFEEATLIRSKSDAVREAVPFKVLAVEFVHLFLAVVITTWRCSTCEWDWMIVLPHVGNLGRVLLENVVCVYVCTSDQYMKMLRQKRGLEGTCERVVREQTEAVLQAIEPICPWEGHTKLPADLRWSRAQFLIGGTAEHVHIVFEVLKDISSELYSSEPAASGNGQEAMPLYEYWRCLAIATSAQTTLSTQTLDDGGLLVQGKQREILLEYGKKLQAQKRRLQQKVSSLGVAAPLDERGEVDTVRALLELDRIKRRKIRLPGGFSAERLTYSESKQYIKQRTEFVQSRNSPVTEETLPNENAAFSEFSDAEVGEAECVCCFDEQACFVFKKCGHLTYCKTCRNKALKKSAANGKFRVRERLCCPICRTESSTVYADDYAGKIYK